ncbi:hypothetical protein N499_0962B, partial [Wolbachia pipientis wVitA]
GKFLKHLQHRLVAIKSS